MNEEEKQIVNWKVAKLDEDLRAEALANVAKRVSAEGFKSTAPSTEKQGP